MESGLIHELDHGWTSQIKMGFNSILFTLCRSGPKYCLLPHNVNLRSKLSCSIGRNTR